MHSLYCAGIVSRPGALPVDETVAKLRAALAERGVTLFALVDHSREAAKVGLAMPPTALLIFGAPAAGTPAMLAAPSCAIDLPLKVLVAADAGGQTWLSYDDPAYLRDRHGLPPALAKRLDVVASLVEHAAA